ncbi:MAG: acylphosphatase [Candidatus Marinimicrobia bacterium]|nr:acylphosphatase [Candidatus Neomarinimicrobiota bacterium]
MKTVHMIVSGRVQGVFFRASTRDEARRLGVKGTVRNRANREVEIVAEGEDGPVDRLTRWARQGPPGARVDSLQVEELPYEGTFEGFTIRH